MLLYRHVIFHEKLNCDKIVGRKITDSSTNWIFSFLYSGKVLIIIMALYRTYFLKLRNHFGNHLPCDGVFSNNTF